MFYSMYEGLIRPCIFQMNPENAHNLIMKSMRIASKSELMCRLLEQKVMSRPCKVMGLEFDNHLG